MEYEVDLSATMTIPSWGAGQELELSEGRVVLSAVQGAPLLSMRASVTAAGVAQAVHTAESIANTTANRLAVATSQFVGSPRVSMVYDSVGGVARPEAEDPLTGSTPPSPEVVDRLQGDSLKQFLETDHGPGERYYPLLRLAYEEADPIATFMILYMVLLNIHSDDWQGLDQFVLSREPAVAMRDSSRRSHRKRPPQETVYTALRHDMSHARDLNIQRIRSEMAEHLPRLRRHVLAAVEQCDS